jgi:hypothetical protein
MGDLLDLLGEIAVLECSRVVEKTEQVTFGVHPIGSDIQLPHADLARFAGHAQALALSLMPDDLLLQLAVALGRVFSLALTRFDASRGSRSPDTGRRRLPASVISWVTRALIGQAGRRGRQDTRAFHEVEGQIGDTR